MPYLEACIFVSDLSILFSALRSVAKTTCHLEKHTSYLIWVVSIWFVLVVNDVTIAVQYERGSVRSKYKSTQFKYYVCVAKWHCHKREEINENMKSGMFERKCI